MINKNVTVRKGSGMRDMVGAFTAYQCVSLICIMIAVYAADASPWLMLAHVAGCFWYVIITLLFIKL